jgi:hypothetical protein
MFRAWVLLVVFGGAVSAWGRTYRSANFQSSFPNEVESAKLVDTADRFYDSLARYWFGKPLLEQAIPIPILPTLGEFAPNGATRSQFGPNSAFIWNISVQGSLERVLDSVIPHEVNHVVLYLHFRAPVARWADEGMASLFNAPDEKKRLFAKLSQNPSRYSLDKLLSTVSYPDDEKEVALLYAQGTIFTDYLLRWESDAAKTMEPATYPVENRNRFLDFLATERKEGWEKALERHYHLSSAQGEEALERATQSILGWVKSREMGP